MSEQVPADLRLIKAVAETCAVYQDSVQLISPMRCAMVKPAALLALVECAEALQGIKTIAVEAHEHWDSDRDSKVGKILIALAGHAPRYRADIDQIHEALAKLEAL